MRLPLADSGQPPTRAGETKENSRMDLREAYTALGNLPTGGDARKRWRRIMFWQRFATVFFIALMVALVVGPIAYVELPREIIRWHLAAAIERHVNGDLDAAISSLDRLIEEYPNNEDLLAERAAWRLENQQYAAALKDADKALQLSPDHTSILELRSQIYQHLSRHRDAIRDWDRLVSVAQSNFGLSLGAALNGRAYARALAKQDLDLAAADIEEALQREGENGAMLDTRGFIRYQQGDITGSLADLDKAVRMTEEEYEKLSKQVDADRLGTIDPRQFELNLRKFAQSVAVIRYHRSLAYDRAGKPDLAEQDRRRVKALGFEINEHLL